MDIAVQIALNAVIAGAIYSLLALGFNLIFSTTRFFDIGYGALVAAGAYATYFLYKIAGLNIFVAIALGTACAGTLGLLVDRFLYRRLRAHKASSTVLLITSLGVLTVVQAVIAILFSSQFQTLAVNSENERLYAIFGGVMTQTQVLILIAGLVVMTVLGLTLRYTKFGKAVRAVADDEEVARIVGIRSDRIIGWIFFIGSAIGGLAGTAVGFDTGIEPTMGMSLLLKGVVAAIIGGVGNVYGGVIGAFILAIIENLGAWQFSGEWKDAIAFLVLIFFLIFKPRGLFPK